ncbi:hypothetical protein HKD37_12G034249 [Glycine soja]
MDKYCPVSRDNLDRCENCKSFKLVKQAWTSVVQTTYVKLFGVDMLLVLQARSDVSAHQWAKRASTAKRSFNALSATKESGRASSSKSHAKREISVLSATIVFSQAQRMTGAKREGGTKLNVANSESI